jgi:ATP-dependent RNA helicase DeaD
MPYLCGQFVLYFMTLFKDLGLSESTLQALELKGFVNPTPIQEQSIPLLLKDDADIVGQAQTGTGKTAAFGLPLIELLKEKSGYPQALILVPTRELAQQVSQEIISLKGDKKLFVATVYGGTSITAQFKDLKKGVEIVVGTPGRVIDHINRGTLKLDRISHLILDEADEMLNMGFVEDIELVISKMPEKRRMLLFSATMPREILGIAKRHMGKYHEVHIEPQFSTAESVEQYYVEVSDRDKNEALSRLIDIENDFYGLIFCMTKIQTDEVAQWLIEHGYAAEAMHGDVAQNQREKTLSLFKKKILKILVATDVAARGIDVKDLTHVINYSLPQDAETYVHRIGRTGRAGKKGIAISLVSNGESRKFSQVKRIVKKQIQKRKLPEVNDIVDTRVRQLLASVNDVIQTNGIERYEKVASELIAVNNPELIIAALLKLNYEKDFDASSYKHIKEFSSGNSGGREGRDGGYNSDKSDKQIRLFIAKGKLDDYNARKLCEFIEKETGVRQRMINNVKVMEKFSFFTVPQEQSEQIIRHFKKNGKGGRSIVERAKD